MPARPPKPADRVASPRYRNRGAADKQRATRELIRDVPTPEDINSIIQQLWTIARDNDGAVAPIHDRAAAIHATALIEYVIEELIFLKMENHDRETKKNLFAENGALGSLFAKIHLAYALGILDGKTKADIDTVRRIRNAFAHAKVNATFKTKEIAAECKTLLPSAHITRPPNDERLKTLEATMTPGQRFLWTCTGIQIRLGVAFLAGSRKRWFAYRKATHAFIKERKALGALTPEDHLKSQETLRRISAGLKQSNTILAMFPEITVGLSKR